MTAELDTTILGDFQRFVTTPRPMANRMTITPGVARHMLERNSSNRPIRETTVANYADEILADRWATTHQGISFDFNGVLVDGQHRLSAIVRADKAVVMLVITGLNESAKMVTDLGRKRGAGEIFENLGFDHGISRAAISTALLRYYKGDTRTRFVVDDLLEAHTEFAPALDWLFIHFSSIRRLKPTSSLMAALVVMRHATPDKANEFMAALASGVSRGNDDPVNLFRQICIQEDSAYSGSLLAKNNFLRACNALRAYVQSLELTRAMPNENGADFFKALAAENPVGHASLKSAHG